MSNALALVYAMGSVTLLALLGLFCELLTGVVRRWWRRRRRAPTLTLKPKADQDNPLMEGCEKDAATLGTPVEYARNSLGDLGSGRLL